MKHMQFRIFCALAMAVVTFAAEAVVQAPNVSRRQDLFDGTLSPALGHPEMSMTATPVGDGFVVAWSSNDGLYGSDGLLHVEHLDSAGAVTRSATVAIELPPYNWNNRLFLLSASDGVETIVLVRHSYDFHVTVHIAADGRITVGVPRRESVTPSELVWNGVAYIARVSTSQGERVRQLDRSGQVIAEASIPASFSRSPFFVDGRNVSMLLASDGAVLRATVTNGEGHVVDPVVTTFPLVIGRNEWIAAAGADGRGLYVLVFRYVSGYRLVFQYLDPDGVPNAAPVVLEGFTGNQPVRTTTSEGAVIVLERGGQHAAVVRRPAAFDRPDPFNRDGMDAGTGPVTLPGQPRVTASAWSRYSYSNDSWNLLPARGGALIVAPVLLSFEYQGSTVATVTSLRADRTGLVLADPTVLQHSRPVMRHGAAAAHGFGYLVVWQQLGLDGGEIWMRYLDSTGYPTGPSRLLGLGVRPKIASQGDVALAVWTIHSAGKQAMAAIRIGPEGNVLDSAPASVRLPEASFPKVVHVGFDATRFNIVFTPDSWLTDTAHVDFSSLSPASLSISLHSNWIGQVPSSVAAAPGRTLLARGSREAGSRVFTMALRHDLTPQTELRTISILSGEPRAAWKGDHFVIVWWHIDHFRYARVSPEGEPLDAQYGRILGEIPFPAWNRNRIANIRDFQLAVRGEQFVIATPRENQPFNPARVAILQPGEKPEEWGAVWELTEDTVDALAAQTDGTLLMVTGLQSGPLYARIVYP